MSGARFRGDTTDTFEYQGDHVVLRVTRESRAALLASFLTVKSVKFVCTPLPDDDWEFECEAQAAQIAVAFLDGC